MKEPKDKRTKEYKEYIKAKHKESVGLGDVIEKITKTTGIKKLVEELTPDNQGCGCDDRKETANKIEVYTKTSNVIIPKEFKSSEEYVRFVNKKIRPRNKLITPFTEELYNDYCILKTEISKGILPKNKDTKSILNKYKKHLFRTFHKDNVSCCLKTHLSEVDKVFNTYQ